MKAIIRFLVGAAATLIVAIIAFNYFTIDQQGKLDEVNHFEQVGKGVGLGIKAIGKIPGQVKESQEYQDFKWAVEESLKDTVQ